MVVMYYLTVKRLHEFLESYESFSNDNTRKKEETSDNRRRVKVIFKFKVAENNKSVTLLKKNGRRSHSSTDSRINDPTTTAKPKQAPEDDETKPKL